MASVHEIFDAAVGQHQAGRLEEADAFYRQVLEVDPNHAGAWHLRGVLASQIGQNAIGIRSIERALLLQPDYVQAHNNLGLIFQREGQQEDAAACFRRAIELNPSFAAAHDNLGVALAALGQLDEAIRWHRRAVELNPAIAEAHNNLGVALHHKGDLDTAIVCFRRAVELRSNYAEAENNLGLALRSQGQSNAAIECFRRALAIHPGFATAFNHLGSAMEDAGRVDEAIAAYRRAIELQPTFAEAYANLGNALKERGVFEDAMDCYQRAIQLKPDVAEFHSNFGNIFKEQRKFDDAIAAYRRALELEPDLRVALGNLGVAYQDKGSFEQAIACYQRTLELNPDHADARVNQSTLLLLLGDLERGWSEYEWRWKRKELNDRQFPQRRWDGSPLGSRTILLHAEQGFGDTFQFIRYAALVKQQNPTATVIVECQRQLVQLLARCPGIDYLIASGDKLPPFDVHSPLLSLPRIFQTALNTIPANVPYLFANDALVEYWHNCLNRYEGLRIGVNWHGREGRKTAWHRDLPFGEIASLAEIPRVRLISLQKGAGQRELAVSPGRWPIADFGDDLDTSHGAFMDTAAIMMNLDLVITSDTSIAHLAGALGVPVWVALPFVPDWRWLLDRSDSPWYPTMRLFRQKHADDWQEVFDNITAALKELVAANDK
jgi:tetratricopeptide (TPR) repeat protein